MDIAAIAACAPARTSAETPTPALEARLLALEAEVAELREQMAKLRSGPGGG